MAENASQNIFSTNMIVWLQIIAQLLQTIVNIAVSYIICILIGM